MPDVTGPAGPETKKMPFAIWSITVALFLGPALLSWLLLPGTDDSLGAAFALLTAVTVASWAFGAALLRHYGKWPWGRNRAG